MNNGIIGRLITYRVEIKGASVTRDGKAFDYREGIVIDKIKIVHRYYSPELYQVHLIIPVSAYMVDRAKSIKGKEIDIVMPEDVTGIYCNSRWKNLGTLEK